MYKKNPKKQKHKQVDYNSNIQKKLSSTTATTTANANKQIKNNINKHKKNKSTTATNNTNSKQTATTRTI